MSSAFSKFILKFVKDTDKKQTHLSFNKGKYNVPDNFYQQFYKEYFTALKSGEDLHLIEKVYNSNFKFFLDIDIPKRAGINLTDEHVQLITDCTCNVITTIFKKCELELTASIVSKCGAKYHINFYNLVVDSAVAKLISSKLFEELAKSEHPNLTYCIDTSVYRTGLRLLGSKKGSGNNNGVYNIYDLSSGKFTANSELTWEQFMKTIVRVTDDISLTELVESFQKNVELASKKKELSHLDSQPINQEIVKLLEELKLTNTEISDMDMGIERIYPKNNKTGMFCYYISIREKRCPFKCREHQRTSYPIYVDLSISGVYIKCYDQDCLRRRYPENGIRLPQDFATRYSQLYMSMSTKYWKSEVVISDDIKRSLEASLTGSHYQIAKTAFMIYRDRFRVDDIKNTTWFEFDGIRWNRSHLMNILISEELPKYYRGIKISDTSVPKNNLQEFLVNDDKIDNNYRNQMVDNIISKLENVTFKNNILLQITYLYKTFDPDFYTNLDANPYLVGFKNGVYDFQQNTFRHAIQSDYLTFSTGYDYIEYDESCPQIGEIYDFLSKIITNTRVREYLLKVLGKALVGIPEEKFYIWTGLSGANGKSTLVNFLEHTLGDYTTSVDVSLLTNKRPNAGNASPDIIRLRGKRIFTFQEPEHDDKLRTGILKQYTGGDTIIARELFKAPVTFKLQGTMIMCCNDLPSVSSIDGGTWRRIRVIEFKSRFCDNPTKPNEFHIDPTIKTKIKEWRPYFMSILIHWYNKYLYEGLNEPEEVTKATDKYKVENDKFNEFFDQCLDSDGCNSGANSFESNKVIYNTFQNWWASNYPSTRVPDIKELRRAMKIKYGNEIEKRISGILTHGFAVGIKSEHFENTIDEDL